MKDRKASNQPEEVKSGQNQNAQPKPKSQIQPKKKEDQSKPGVNAQSLKQLGSKPRLDDDDLETQSISSAGYSTQPVNSQQIQIQGGNVMVVCRVRPLNRKELEMGTQICLDFQPNKKDVTLKLSQETAGISSMNKFMFDRVFDPVTSQKEIYDVAAKSIIDSVLEGFNGTIFAYGQTSSGKTHTMQGPDIEDMELQGIIPRMVRTVFNRIETASENIEFTVKLSMIEIYMERIKDLLDPNKDNLKIHEDKTKGVYIADVTETYVAEELEVYQIMKLGNSNRSIASTLMNAESSRSHSIFILTVTQNNLEDLSCKTGKLYLVDLAGSEKISKTGATGTTLDEAKMINKSLTTLGKVITALTDKKSSHVPYRESKLTRILQESLGGNSRTCLVITCSPHPFNEMETLSTLRFGQRARNIKNQPKVNREYTVPELKRLLEKAEADLDIQKCKVKALEGIIMELGGNLPQEEELALLTERQKEEEERMIDELKDNDYNQEETKEELKEEDEDLQQRELESALNVPSELLQEKIDQIEILQLQLFKEKEKQRAFEKQVADISEEYQIQTQKFNHLLQEKDNLSNKLKDSLYKIQQLNEKIQDKDEKIEQQNSKVEILGQENNQIKESYEKLMSKLTFIQENHILIPKDGKRKDENKMLVGMADEEYLNNLQEEVRKLHFMLKQKETIIDRLKQAVSSAQNEDQDPEEGFDLKLKKLNSLLDKDVNAEKESKQYDQEILKMLVTIDKNIMDEEQLKLVQYGVLITAKDIKQIFYTQNDYKLQLIDLENQNKQLEKDIGSLKADLKAELEKEMPNIQEITSKIVKEKLDEERKKFDWEKEQMIKDLQNRVEKVLRLEMELDEVKDAYRALESSLSRDEQQFKNRAQKLERSLEQMTTMYQGVINERSVLKVDLQVSEKKMQRKEEKITQLEKSLGISREKQQQLQTIIQHLRTEFLKVQQQAQMHIGGVIEQDGGFKGVSKIAKPIRGGGGKRLQTPRSTIQVGQQNQGSIIQFEQFKDRPKGQ